MLAGISGELPSKARRTKKSSTSNSCHGGFPVIISITMQPRDQISKLVISQQALQIQETCIREFHGKCTGKRISLNCLRQALLPSQNPQFELKILLIRRENKDIGRLKLGAWVHQELEQQMPSSDIPSKILCQVIKIDLQDMQQQTPCQQLIAKDLHGNEWNFQHVNQSKQ
ncbi:hypothetical protein GH714_001644 [Hevea brasiliensis]|uniref:Uncharacterized protein n=1 Tax=Hevea brasiliensis TaxID=3981 RepID=A0A6A6M6K6_HEVBR|nr:hypothetical protein GH714_001644 [Hevea brasiliensis]